MSFCYFQIRHNVNSSVALKDAKSIIIQKSYQIDILILIPSQTSVKPSTDLCISVDETMNMLSKDASVNVDCMKRIPIIYR